MYHCLPGLLRVCSSSVSCSDYFSGSIFTGVHCVGSDLVCTPIWSKQIVFRNDINSGHMHLIDFVQKILYWSSIISFLLSCFQFILAMVKPRKCEFFRISVTQELSSDLYLRFTSPSRYFCLTLQANPIANICSHNPGYNEVHLAASYMQFLDFFWPLGYLIVLLSPADDSLIDPTWNESESDDSNSQCSAGAESTPDLVSVPVLPIISRSTHSPHSTRFHAWYQGLRQNKFDHQWVWSTFCMMKPVLWNSLYVDTFLWWSLPTDPQDSWNFSFQVSTWNRCEQQGGLNLCLQLNFNFDKSLVLDTDMLLWSLSW